MQIKKIKILNRRRTAPVIMVNPDNKVLLHLRDNKKGILYPNTWGFLGGHIEKGESPRICALRELYEEIEYSCNLSFFKRYLWKNEESFIFICETPLRNPKAFPLHEGQKLEFFGEEEIRNLILAGHVREILRDFFQGEKRIKSVQIQGMPETVISPQFTIMYSLKNNNIYKERFVIARYLK